MDKAYDHKKVEDNIYKRWEEGGYFKPEGNPDGEPFSIILPPPNANGNLHFGHAMMSIEDVMIRYQRMKGKKALFLPGADHAGFETQFVFEKKLSEKGKSRFDYDRETLYQMIWDYVLENKGNMENQLRKLGFSLDWSRERFTLDPEIVKVVYKTFKKMYDDKLIYRGNRLVNYCTFDGTSFSDLETVNEEKEGKLYFIKFLVKEGGEITIATTRPETMLGDVAVMVNPEDKRYKDLVGKTAILPIVNREIPIIADSFVDMEFGTGAVKVTPAHDFKDFEIAKKHGLFFPPVIGFDGKIQNTDTIVDGLYVKPAREKVLELLKEQGFFVKEESHKMVIKTCYKCKRVLEPLPLEQWYVKVKPLADKAIEAVKNKDIRIFPKNFETHYFQWLENLNDWNISRQIVWGIRIPAWRNIHTGEWIVTEGEKPQGDEWEQDSDTFDTWFSSSQWPFATLMVNENDFEIFYPTNVMETGYDILKAWVSRMAMLGIYVTGKVPFKDVVLHGLVNDPYGKKMSKSKGNVINPLDLVDEYGADAVRFALIYGNATGNDQALSYPKLEAARRFTNKIWNIGRFIEMNNVSSSMYQVVSIAELQKLAIHESDKDWVEKVSSLTNEVTRHLDEYQFNLVAERLYEFIWHEFADKYIEEVKIRQNENSFLILNSLFLILLKLLHPIMPFVTEEIYGKFNDKPLIVSTWPSISR